MKKRILCALLAVTLLLSLSSCFLMPSSPEDTAKEYLIAVAEKNADRINEYSAVDFKKLLLDIIEANGIDLQEYFSLHGSAIIGGKTPKDIDDLFTLIFDESKKQLAERYGDDYKVTSSVVSSVALSADELAAVIESVTEAFDGNGVPISDYIETSKITECKKIECKSYIKGSKGEIESYATLYLAKFGAGWKVLNALETANL